MNWLRTAEQIKLDEGCELKMYPDSVGIQTIGYGRNLEANGITKEESEYLFATDLRRAYFCARRLFPVFEYLDDARQGVLVNMAFNMGYGTLSTFKNFRAALEKRDFESAAFHMSDSKWFNQVGKRAERLAGLMRSAPK